MSFSVTPPRIDDGRQRAIVLVVTLIAIVIDGAAEPATGGILSSAARDFGGSESLTTFIKVGFSVAYDLAILCSLWLISNHGKRGYFCGSLIGYAVACLVCAIAPSDAILVGARVLQGAFLGGLFACALLTMVGVSPPNRLPLVFALFTILALAAPELAPFTSALLATHFGWRAVFAALSILPLAGGAIAITIMKDVQAPRAAEFDTGSFLAVALFLLTFHAIAESAGGVSFGTAADLFTVAICVLALVWFLVREARFARAPFVDLRPFRSRLAGQGLLACVLLGIVLGGSVSLVTFGITVLHLSPFASVTLSSASFIGAAVGTIVVYRIWISHVLDNRIATIVGLATLAICYALQAAAAFSGLHFVAIYAALSIVEGFGLALTIGPLASLLFDGVAHDQFGALALLFKIALVIGSACAVPLLAVTHDFSTLWLAFVAAFALAMLLIATVPMAMREAPEPAST